MLMAVVAAAEEAFQLPAIDAARTAQLPVDQPSRLQTPIVPRTNAGAASQLGFGPPQSSTWPDDAFVPQGDEDQPKLGEVYINSSSLEPFSSGAGTFASQVGVIHTSYTPPKWITGRIGIGGTLGTHTHLADTHVGIAGVLPLRWSYLDYNLSQSFGVLGRQWSYEFPGIEAMTAFEAAWRLPLNAEESRQIGLGWRGHWYENRSWDEVHGRTPSFERNFSIMGQRVGTLFVQYDWKQVDDFQRLRFEFGNDAAITGGTGDDEFRTAQARLLYLRQRGDIQYRIGGVLDLFTGVVDQNRVVDEFYVRNGVEFENWSQGFLGLELGASWFHRINHLMTGELGFNLFIGPDTEGIRDLTQNRITHEPQGIPQVPVIERSDRFRFDVRLFYIIHFGAT